MLPTPRHSVNLSFETEATSGIAGTDLDITNSWPFTFHTCLGAFYKNFSAYPNFRITRIFLTLYTPHNNYYFCFFLQVRPPVPSAGRHPRSTVPSLVKVCTVQSPSFNCPDQVPTFAASSSSNPAPQLHLTRARHCTFSGFPCSFAAKAHVKRQRSKQAARRKQPAAVSPPSQTPSPYRLARDPSAILRTWSRVATFRSAFAGQDAILPQRQTHLFSLTHPPTTRLLPK